jgi:hypothetical protein
LYREAISGWRHAARADEGNVRDLACEAHHLRTPATNGDRHSFDRSDHASLLDDERGAADVDVVTREQAANRGDRLAQSGDRARIAHPERFEAGAHTEAEECPALAGVLQRRRHTRQHGGMPRVRIGNHAAKTDRRRPLRDQPEQHEAVWPEDHIADTKAIKAGLLREHGELDDFRGGHAGCDLGLDRHFVHGRRSGEATVCMLGKIVAPILIWSDNQSGGETIERDEGSRGDGSQQSASRPRLHALRDRVA